MSCDDGDLRLVGGETEYEGLLEVCFSQRWGTVNGDGWSASDTQVACRQLGFDTLGKCMTLTNSVCFIIRESVDSLCMDDMDAPIVYYILKASKLSNAWILRLLK